MESKITDLDEIKGVILLKWEDQLDTLVFESEKDAKEAYDKLIPEIEEGEVYLFNLIENSL